MIRGRVEENGEGGLEGWLAVPVERALGGLRQCEFVIDTGFTGWLMLPESVIRDLGLASGGKITVTLATGEESQVDYYLTRALWHDELSRIEVIGSIDQSLLGMEMLRGNRIAIDAWEGGEVIIEEVPPAG